MAKRGNPYHDPATGEFSASPDGGTLRYSQMSKKGKAKLRASAQVVSKFDNTGRVTGTKVRNIPTPFQPSTPHAHAVALKTAHELDKDFHRNKDKVAHVDMHNAIAKYTGRVTKLPPGKASAPSGKKRR